MRDLGRRAVVGSLSTAGGSLVAFALRFVVSAGLARFIAPDDFGVYAQASVYTTALGVLHAFSLPQALLQLGDLPGLVPTVRRATTLLSLGVVAIGLLAWPLIAALRGPDVAHCFVGLGLAQAITSIGSTYEGALQREHRWHAAVGLKLGAAVASSAIVIPLGLAAPGPFVLVLRDALAPLLMVAWVIGVSRLHARRGARTPTADPGRYDRATAREVWALGRAMFWTRALEMAFHKVDSALVGEYLGRHALGFYDQARYLAGLPNTALSPVSNTVGLRLLAQLENDPVRRTRAFTLLQWGIARLVFVFALGALLAPDLGVRIIYGPAWAESAPILRAFALWAAFIPLSTSQQIFLMALRDWARIRVGFILGIAAFALSIVVLAPAFGAVGVAIAHTLAVALELVFRARGTAPHLGLVRRDYIRIALPVALATGIGTGVGLAAGLALPATWLGQLAVLTIGLAAAGATFALVEGRDLMTNLRYLRDVARRRA